MAEYAITRHLDRLASFVGEEAEMSMTVDGNRAYLFNREGDVVSTLLRNGENEATLRFRLLAALTAVATRGD